MERNEAFLQHLYKEKEIHKEHRQKHVLYKLILTGSFFGLGQFARGSDLYNLFLYVVPFIAMVHDIYISGEHFKVQRVGMFLKNFEGIDNSPLCPEELLWEKYLERHRETWAYKASIFYSTLITAFSATAIYFSDINRVGAIYYTWLGICGFLLLVVVIRVKQMSFKIERMNQPDPETKDEILRYYSQRVQ